MPEVVQKGLILELFSLFKTHNLPWDQFSSWLKQLYGTAELARRDTLRKSLTALQTKRSNLLKSASNAAKLSALLEEPYHLPISKKKAQAAAEGTSSAKRFPCQENPSMFDQVTSRMVTMELAAEVNYWKERSQLLEQQNHKLLTVVKDYTIHAMFEGGKEERK